MTSSLKILGVNENAHSSLLNSNKLQTTIKTKINEVKDRVKILQQKLDAKEKEFSHIDNKSVGALIVKEKKKHASIKLKLEQYENDFAKIQEDFEVKRTQLYDTTSNQELDIMNHEINQLRRENKSLRQQINFQRLDFKSFEGKNFYRLN